MKKWVILLVLGVVFAACEELENGIDLGLDEMGTIKLFEQNIIEKNLVITQYIEDGEDKSAKFSDYGFLFSTEGTIDAIFNADTINGTWKITQEDSIPKIMINFGDVDEPLKDLNEDWLLESQSETKIELKDISGKGGSIDYLTFEEE